MKTAIRLPLWSVLVVLGQFGFSGYFEALDLAWFHCVLAFPWATAHNAFTGSQREQSRLIFKSPVGCWKPTPKRGSLKSHNRQGFNLPELYS